MQYQLAVIGYGGMGAWHVSNIREKIPEIRVQGIYDVRPEAKEKAKEDGLLVYESPEEMYRDNSLDIITIATPNNFHKDYAISALRAGKHVVCEKPVTMNAEELEEIIAVAKETGRLFSIHQNRRWDKDYRIIKQIADCGMIGKPYFVESRVQGSRGAMHGWRGYQENGGGMVLDWGVHLLDQMMQLNPTPVVSVGAHLCTVFSGEVEDNIKLFLRFENGMSAVLEMSTNCFVNLPRWHVSCTDGTAVVEGWDCKGSIVKLNTDSQMEWENDIVYTEAGPTRTMAPRPVHTTEQLPLPEVTADWAEYYQNIIAVLSDGAELIVKPEEALRVMKVIDLVFEADRRGETLRCQI